MDEPPTDLSNEPRTIKRSRANNLERTPPFFPKISSDLVFPSVWNLKIGQA